MDLHDVAVGMMLADDDRFNEGYAKGVSDMAERIKSYTNGPDLIGHLVVDTDPLSDRTITIAHIVDSIAAELTDK